MSIDIGQFETKLGKVNVHLHDTEVYVYADCISVNGVDYNFGWHIPWDEVRKVYHDGGRDAFTKWRPYLSRLRSFDNATPAAYDKVKSVFLEFANSGVVTDENRRQARQVRLNEEIARVEAKIVELTDELDELMKDRKSLIAALDSTVSV